MSFRFSRRDFLASSAVLGAAMALGVRADAGEWKTTLQKALIGEPTEEFFKVLKDNGFQGLETCNWKKPVAEAAADRAKAEAMGLRIHSVLFGWGAMNGSDADQAKSVAEMEAALQTAKAYGADTVLFVPCRTDVAPMPNSWEFDIRFDEKTGHVHQVVAGDNSKFAKYIEAQNFATDATRKNVQKLIPAAEKAGVVIALENVWNNLWVKPDLAANFIASFDSPWVRAYYDIGNHVKYAPSQDWIRTLGKLLVKCHAKDYKLGPDGREVGMPGFVNLRNGSVDWPAVRKALDEIGYSGFVTIEGSTLTPKEDSERLDLIFAGA